MSSESPLSTVKEGVSLAAEIIKIAADDPNAKEAAKNLGQTALTITKTINNVLLPLAAVNFAFDKARTYFDGKFAQDLSEKIASIPAESIVEPKASIAGPALQGLAFSHEEPDLKNMYLNLLATAMDGRVASYAHPAFVEIIKQMTSEEAHLIRGILCPPRLTAIVEIHSADAESLVPQYSVAATHLLNLAENDGRTPVENPRLSAIVDNWLRLGLVAVCYDKYIPDDSQYEWVERRPEIARIRAMPANANRKVTHQKGIIEPTQLGLQFATAVGILQPTGDTAAQP